MEKKSVNKLAVLPSHSTATSLETSKTTSTSSATGNPRNKCALKPGHSLMHWIRLGNSGVDLAGTGGRRIPVSKEELAKHNILNDAWIAINGVVYNVTQYMNFHPGGVEELMRGVGSDATKLFNEVHAWVNYSQLLNKCIIGPLTTKTEHKKSLVPGNDITFENLSRPLHLDDIVPRLDWIQKRDDITLFFYTKQFCNPGLIIRNLSPQAHLLEVWIIISLYVHKFKFELQGRIKWPPQNVKISTESGKIELKLNKHAEHINLWTDLGKYKSSKILVTALDLDKDLEFKMFHNNKFNHDSFIMALKNENAIYHAPVGYHITIEDFVNGTRLSKCYTPVPKIYTDQYINIEVDMECIYFLIKCYQNENSFSQHLYNLKNATIKLSLPEGNLKLSTLATHRKFCFLAAGSGLTPFLSLIEHLLNRQVNRIETIKLFYFNKTKADIWCREFLTNMSSKDGRFEFINVLSNADESWSGLKGKVCSDLLFPNVDKPTANFFYIAACGPFHFITSVKSILNELNFPNENFFTF